MSSEDKKHETKRFKTSEVKKKVNKKSNSETQVIGTVKGKNKSGRSEGSKKVKFKDKHPRIVTIIKILLVVFMLVFIIGGGVVAGTFFGLFGDELKITESELSINFENSNVYDSEGNHIAVLSGGTKRKSVSISEMAEYLPSAYVAIEDERYYTHAGVDFKRFGAAVATYAVNGGKSSFGGSTITQQVIKNLTEEKASSGVSGALRKIKEISKSIQVEHYLSKDQILELYLNLIYIGGGDDINGVALGAIYYFNKDVKELSIAECAFMAGINHTPNSYRPFDVEEEKAEEMKTKINKRTKTVISKMKELGQINEEQYNTAVAEVDNGLNFQKGDVSVTTEVSYHTEAALKQVVNQAMEEKGLNRNAAELYIYSSGFNIYTTQVTAIQNRIEEELAKDKYSTTSVTTNKNGEKQKSMANMAIIDHTTGKVVGVGSGVGQEKTKTRLGYFNWPTEMKKQTGSSMKPISVIAPGLESGVITPATVYDDNPTSFGKWSPKNYNGYHGLMNMRTAIGMSANVPHAKALSNIGVDKAIQFCASVGITNLKNEGLSLALGGLDEGVSVLQMAAAYGAIANDGIYIEPTFYEKVTDTDGNTLFTPTQESRKVMSRSNSYVEKKVLTEPVVGAVGTAPYCAIPNMEVAAKTGTTNDDFDRWLCGFTSYYSAAVWFGYEENATVYYGNGNPAGRIWAAVMTDIHKGLEGKIFQMPEDVVTVSICRDSGKKATDKCINVYSEVFSKGGVPAECDGHELMMICTETGLLASEGCPIAEQRVVTKPPEKEQNPTWVTTGTTFAVPTEHCPHSGGGGAPPAEHQHSFTISTVQPTEFVDGSQTETCTICGYSTTKTLPKTHVHKFTIKTAAKCTTAGEETCTCGEKKTIPATGKHNYVATSTTPATCTVKGSKTSECSICKDIKTEEILALGHDFSGGGPTCSRCTEPKPQPNNGPN